MRYVIAGYVVVLTLLFLYGVQLVWRRRRLNRLGYQTIEASPAPYQLHPVEEQEREHHYVSGDYVPHRDAFTGARASSAVPSGSGVGPAPSDCRSRSAISSSPEPRKSSNAPMRYRTRSIQTKARVRATKPSSNVQA